MWASSSYTKKGGLLMWRIPSLARPDAWLCLLGSVLAFAAFFLPFYGSPPVNYWDVLLFWIGEQDGIAALVLGLLLLTLSGMIVSSCLIVCFNPTRWGILPKYLAFTGLAWLYLIIALLLVFLTLVKAAELYSISLPAMRRLVNLSICIMPGGLLLALRGGILLYRKNRRQTAENAPVPGKEAQI
jgi:hypothetical protein